MQAHTASQGQTQLQQKGKRIHSRKAKPAASESTWPAKVVSADRAALRQRGQDLLSKMSQGHVLGSMTQSMHGTLGGDVSDGLWDYSPHSSLYVEPDNIPSVLSSCPVQESKVHKQAKVIEPRKSCSAGLLALRQQGRDTLSAISPWLVAESAKVPGDMNSNDTAQVCASPQALNSDLWVEEPGGRDDLSIFSAQQHWQNSAFATLPTRPPPGLEAPVILDAGTKLPPGLEPPPGLQPSKLTVSDVPQLSGSEPSKAVARSVGPSQVAPTLLQRSKHRNCKKFAIEQEPLKVDLGCLRSLSVVS